MCKACCSRWRRRSRRRRRAIEIYRKNNQVEETSSSSGSNCSRRKISRIWNASAGGFKASFPAKTSDVTYICDSFSRGTQAQTDAVIGGERSKALGLGSSSRIDTATTSLPSAMGGNKKRSKLAKHQLRRSQERRAVRTRRMTWAWGEDISSHHRPNTRIWRNEASSRDCPTAARVARYGIGGFATARLFVGSFIIQGMLHHYGVNYARMCYAPLDMSILPCWVLTFCEARELKPWDLHL